MNKSEVLSSGARHSRSASAAGETSISKGSYGMKDFWSNNKKIILGTVGALAVISCAAVLLCVGLSKSREKTSANTLEAISQSTIVMWDL